MVADYLRELGLTVSTGIAGHGVVADLEGARPGRTVAYRADMDALPFRRRSRSPGAPRWTG